MLISEVMRRFYEYDLDIIMLMRKYGEEIKSEQKQAQKIKQQLKDPKRNKRRMRR